LPLDKPHATIFTCDSNNFTIFAIIHGLKRMDVSSGKEQENVNHGQPVHGDIFVSMNVKINHLE